VAAKVLTLYVSQNRSFLPVLLHKFLIKSSHTSIFEVTQFTVHQTLAG